MIAKCCQERPGKLSYLCVRDVLLLLAQCAVLPESERRDPHVSPECGSAGAACRPPLLSRRNCTVVIAG